jgi:CBS domain-containing protein
VIARRRADRPDWWRVRDVMTTHVISVAPTATPAAVADLLVSEHVSGVPVTDADGRLIGVVTEADLVRRQARAGAGAAGQGHAVSGAIARTETAGTLMTRPAVTASPDDDLPTTARTLVTSGHRRLPVVAGDGRLVGVVSRRDLLTPAWDYDDR